MGCGSFAFEDKARSVNGIAVVGSVPGPSKEGDNDAVTGYGGLRRADTPRYQRRKASPFSLLTIVLWPTTRATSFLRQGAGHFSRVSLP